MGPYRILVVTAKPPHPVTDGGRASTDGTVRAMLAAGMDVRVVSLSTGDDPERVAQAPYPIRLLAPPRLSVWGRARSVWKGSPVSTARFNTFELFAAVEQELGAFVPNVLFVDNAALSPLVHRFRDSVAVI